MTAYTLYIDEVQITPSFQLVSTAAAPSGLTLTRTIDFAPPVAATPAEIAAWQAAHAGVEAGLVRGGQYRLYTQAVNALGASDASEELRVALGRLPAQPGAPTKVEAESASNATISSLMIEWTQSTAIDGIDIDGYTLYMDDGYLGEFKAIYVGKADPQTFKFLATGLVTGLPYRFAVSASNVNGESPSSSASTIYACL